MNIYFFYIVFIVFLITSLFQLENTRKEFSQNSIFYFHVDCHVNRKKTLQLKLFLLQQRVKFKKWKKESRGKEKTLIKEKQKKRNVKIKRKKKNSNSKRDKNLKKEERRMAK